MERIRLLLASMALLLISAGVASGQVTITTTSLPNGTVDENYSQTLQAMGGGIETWTVIAGALPPGLGQTGVFGQTISGAPTTAGTFAFTVRATGLVGGTDEQDLSITISTPPLSITSNSPLPPGTQDASYNPFTFQGSGGVPASYSWARTGANPLPNGMALSTGGVLSGAPTQTGTFVFQVTLSDGVSTPAAENFSLTINPPALSITSNSPLPAGTQNALYSSFTFQGSGGVPASYSWARTGGNQLPNGMSLSAGGVLSGTPTQTGTFVFQVTLSDGVSTPAVKNFSLTINPPSLSITSNSTLPAGMQDASYPPFTFQGSGGVPASYSWARTGGDPLPNGMALSNGGVLSGAPTQSGSFSFQITLSDGVSTPAVKTFALTINPPALSITSNSPLPAGAQGASYTPFTFQGSGGVPASYSWARTGANPLPTGMTLSTAGVLSGAPTQTGTFVFQVTLSDGVSTPVAKSFSLTVTNPVPAITTLNPASAAAGSGPVSLTITGTNFVSGATVSFGGGAPLPTSNVASNELTVTVPASAITTAGPRNVIVTNPTPGGGQSNALPFTVNNPSPTISNLSPNSAAAGSGPVPLTISGTNFVSGATVTFGGGAPLPTSNVTGNQLTVTVPASAITTAGPRNVTVTNPTPGGGTSSALTFTVNNPTPTVSSLNPSATTAGLGQFALAITGTNFVSGATVSFGGTNLTPSNVSPTQITVTVPAPSIATAGSRSVTVTNPAPGGGTSAPATFTVNPPVQVTTTSLPAGVFGVQYSQTLAASGGTGSINWSVSGGSLPPGLSRNGSQISGTPTGVGSFSFTVTATDSRGASDDQGLTIEINNPVPGVLSLSPASAVAGGPAFTLTVNGPGNSNSFVPSSVVRWNGENLTTTFVSATQLTASAGAERIALAGSAAVSVATPGPGGGTSNAVSFEIRNPSDLSITNVIPGAAIAGGSTLQITVRGSNFVPNSAVRWIGQAVPATFISPTEITATIDASLLAAAGTAGITVVNPPPGGGTSNVFTFIINNPLPLLSGINPDGKSAGQPGFTLTLTGSNFISSSQVSWNGMALPSTFTSPTELRVTVPANLIANPGTASVTVENPEPGGGISAARTFTIGNQLTITTETPLPSGTISVPYSRTINAVGGDPPYRWGLATGSQTPPGLTLNANSGVLSGTPTEIGTYSVNIQVTDSLNVAGSKAFVLTISPATFVITTASPLPNAQLAAAYTQTFAASGGTAPYVNWSVTGGQLPGGLTLNTANGTLSGTPNAAGAFNFTITVTDNASETASKQFTLAVPPPGNVLTILTTSCPAAAVGAAYECPFTASGGVPGYTWAITAGTLPAGLALNTTTGLISGTPQTVGQANLTMRVTDAVTATDTQTFTINVTAATVTISLLGTPGPAQQNQVTLTLPQALGAAVTGTVALSFTPDPALPNGGTGLDDPAIQFSGGGRTASFNVPAGSTEATFTGGNLMLQTGTIAGTVTVTLTSMQSGGSVITPSPAPSQTVVVGRLAPVISSVRIVNRTAAGFSIEITGYATPRELTQAGFQFTGQNLQGAQATVQLATVAQTWYASQASLAFGSLFTYAQPFTTSADPAGIASVSVTLTNSLGNSAAVSANF